MNQNMQLQFSSLVHQIADCLCLGQVSFDPDLNILDMTSIAAGIIYPDAGNNQPFSPGRTSSGIPAT